MIPNAALGPLFGRLGFRLMAAFGIALLPLAFLSYNQAQKFSSETEARLEAALFGETLLAATSQIETMNRARGLAASLAVALVPVTEDVAACVRVMQAVVASEPDLTFAGYIPVAGNVTCASTRERLRFAERPGLVALLADPKPMMTVNIKGPLTGESVLLFSHPVKASDGRLLGFVSLSMPHRALKLVHLLLKDQPADQLEPLALMTFDGDGHILTAPYYGIETAPARLPANRALTEFTGLSATTFRDTIPSGETRLFSVVAIVPGTLYVLGSWPVAYAANSGYDRSLPLWVFPLAMWLASMMVAYLAAENQTLRHVRALRRSIIAFAGGNRQVGTPDLSGAPNELRDVGRAYESLMGSVLRDEAAMEDAVFQKEVLLREVHHRVKNNLQLIASIMNLQIRKAVNPDAKALMRGLHERVMSLATVHRELYQTSGLVAVRADELLETIVAQVLRMAARSDQLVESKTAFEAIRLTPDQAVPLSLILTEALTNALKHASPSAPGKIALSISLRQADQDHAILEVLNSAGPEGPAAASSDLISTGLGQQLLMAFASQLMGALSMGHEDGSYFVRLNFPLHAPPPEETDLPVA